MAYRLRGLPYGVRTLRTGVSDTRSLLQEPPVPFGRLHATPGDLGDSTRHRTTGLHVGVEGREGRETLMLMINGSESSIMCRGSVSSGWFDVEVKDMRN